MDQRLVEAARVGDVMTLQRIMKEDPDILERASSAHFADSPLHVAALYGKADFVEQIVTLMPTFALETNQKGMIPLHLASIKGHVEIVRQLLKAKLDDGELNQCLVKDEEGWTPLHWASKKGKISIIEELIRECPECLEQVTAKGETVLHLAIKANQFEAVKVLADSIKHHNLHKVFKAEDQKGKSAYQLAVAKKQLQLLEALKEDEEEVDGMREERRINVEGEGEGSEDNEASKKEEEKNNEWASQRDAILVVTTLIITLTYQTLANPPSTFFKDGDTKIDWGCVFRKNKSHGLTNRLKECPAVLPGTFLVLNSMIFIQSILIVVLALRSTRLGLVLHLVQMLTVYLIICYSIMLTAINYNLIYISVLSVIIVTLVAVGVSIKVLVHVIKNKNGFKRIDLTRCPHQQHEGS